MKEIPLTRGMVAIVDDADFDWLNQWKWLALSAGRGRFYAARYEGKRAVLMHREILGATKGKVVDHANHLTLQNTRDNLRLCTQRENMANRRKLAQTRSPYKGVVAGSHGRGTWRARIKVDGRDIYLGTFPTEEAAAAAYNAKARELFGEFAYLNPMPGERP